ncbi:DUF4059 family protein [Streptococcus downei]|uniref:Thioredoxin n=1 Tax=Streptococcus downei MFe28 TaxID=764290 RepID=A0A380JC98_STRDO|nr:DUF4059 family protein [Streptococcus downei]EFQ56420.1 hypothetical protein HMPREF9176_0410 [Streptococcus downei F0415]SUN35698.1 thioredoxin [Streptococcus downei MFe28]
MLTDIFKFYLQGLFMAIAFVIFAVIFWIAYRALKLKDKTIKERQNTLYDGIMMALISIPILSFAFMAIVLMIRS